MAYNEDKVYEVMYGMKMFLVWNRLRHSYTVWMGNIFFLNLFKSIDSKYSFDKLLIVNRTYPECACALCKAAWDHAEVLGSSPAIGKAVNAEGGNCNGNPFLSNIFLIHWFKCFRWTSKTTTPHHTIQDRIDYDENNNYSLR